MTYVYGQFGMGDGYDTSTSMVEIELLTTRRSSRKSAIFIKMHDQFAQVKHGFIKTLSESEIIERSHQLPGIDIKSMAEWIGGAPKMVPP